MLCLKLNLRHFDHVRLSGVVCGDIHRKRHTIMMSAGICLMSGSGIAGYNGREPDQLGGIGL
jgi:hypothetical protein